MLQQYAVHVWVGLIAAAVTAGGGCRGARCWWWTTASGGGVSLTAATLDIKNCSSPHSLNSDGPARPLVYPRETTT